MGRKIQVIFLSFGGFLSSVERGGSETHISRYMTIGCSGWLVCYGGKFLLQEQIITGDSLHIDLSGFCYSHLPSSTHMWESLRCPLVRHHFIWTQLEFEKGNDFFCLFWNVCLSLFYGCECFICMDSCTTCMPSALRSHRRVSAPLDL